MTKIPNTIPESMGACSFLMELGSQERERLLTMSERRDYAKGDFIFRAGSPAEHVYLLIDGRVKIFELSSLGREVILWFCFNGEIFGLAETPRGTPREVYAMACTATRVYAIKNRDFRDFLGTNPKAAMLVIDLLSCRMRGLGSMLLNVSSEDVATRVIKLLTRLGAAYGLKKERHLELGISLTHQELADMIGTTRQSVSTVMGELRRQGLVEMRDHRIVLTGELGAEYHQQPDMLKNRL